MAWVGDISRIGKLAARIDRLRTTPMDVRERIAKRLEGLIQEQFDAGSDPYGNSWAPLADYTIERGRTPPPLTDTGEMRGDLRVRPARGAVVEISIPHPAGVHQTGWTGPLSSGPARPILPKGSQLPPRWKEVIDTEVRRDVEDKLR